MTPIDESAGMREVAEELEGAQTEAEHGAPDVPLEADEPEVERSHPGAEDGDEVA